MMRVFIPTRCATNRMQTCSLDLPWQRNFIVHDMEQAGYFANAERRKPNDEVFVTDTTDITEHRNYIDTLLRKDEWYIRADDNIRYFVGSDGNQLGLKDAWSIIQEAISEAERRKARLVGFATVDNPFFRKTKYRDVGFVIGKMYAVKHNPEIRSTGQIIMMDDYERTAQHLERYGRVLVCNALHSKAKHYEPGGLGTWEERLERKMQDVKTLISNYQGLFREKIKSGKEKGSEVQIRFWNVEQVEAWRLFRRSETSEASAH